MTATQRVRIKKSEGTGATVYQAKLDTGKTSPAFLSKKDAITWSLRESKIPKSQPVQQQVDKSWWPAILYVPLAPLSILFYLARSAWQCRLEQWRTKTPLQN